MNASKFTDAQKAFIINQSEGGTPITEVCRKAGISLATFLNWMKKHAGLMSPEMKRLRDLEQESATEEDRRRPLARQGDAAARYQAKALRPARKRALVDEMRAD